jgi:hypothetical protein
MTISVGCCASSGNSAPRAAPAGTEHEHALAGERNAQVALYVVDEANAVEVVRDDAAPVELERVRRPGELGARKPFAGEIVRLHLERRRDVHPAPARRAERIDRR